MDGWRPEKVAAPSFRRGTMQPTAWLHSVITANLILCKVTWASSSDDQLTALVRVHTDASALPRPESGQGVEGHQERVGLPPIVEQEAIHAAMTLAKEFAQLPFEQRER